MNKHEILALIRERDELLLEVAALRTALEAPSTADAPRDAKKKKPRFESVDDGD